jgi:tetratricopeptide (TPR) repeat protein
VLALCALFPLHARSFAFSMDDAFISIRYAHNLIQGHGLVFNPGERVEGYSNFSWTILLALILKAGLPPLESARWLGVALAAASALVAARFARAFEGRWGPIAAGTALLVLASTPLAYWSASGMETALFVLLVTAAVDRGVAPDAPRGRRLAPVLFGLAALTRPDGPLFFAVWLALRAAGRGALAGLRDPRGARGVAADLGVFLAMVVPFLAWKYAYYGGIVPNTYYAKSGFTAAYFTRGVEYLREWLRAYLLFGAVPVLGLLSLRDARRRAALAGAAVLILAYSAYVVAIGGDVLPIFRFWLTVVPLGSAMVVLGAAQAARMAGRRAGAPWIALGAAAALAATGFLLNHDWIRARREADLSAFDKIRSIALWLKERVPPGETIASTSNGAIAWYSERPILDMLGLTDAEIARRPEPIENLSDTWKEKKYNAASVLRRRPAAIVFSTGLRPSAMAEKALFLYEDFHRAYCLWEFRYDARSTAYHAVYRRRPDAPPPPAELVPAPERRFLEEFERALKAQARLDTREEALEAFTECVRLAPPWFRMARSWRALLADELDAPEAQAWLEEVVAEDPMAVRAACALGRRRAQAGDWEGAEALFRDAVRANPDWPSAWEGLAVVASHRGDWESVLSLAGRSLDLWSTNPPDLLLYGEAAVRLGLPDNAERAYERALLLIPDSPEARNGLLAVARLREDMAASAPGAAPQR